MLIELIPFKAACFACRNIQVSASSWIQCDTKFASIPLLLLTFILCYNDSSFCHTSL